MNESPTGVTINNNLAGVGIPENTQPGYIIGNLGCVDPDNYHVCTFTLLGNSTDFFTVNVVTCFLCEISGRQSYFLKVLLFKGTQATRIVFFKIKTT